MSKPEILIEEALQFAKDNGHLIIRGGVFDWTATPVSCNAFGAILIKLGKADLFRKDFPPNWIKWVTEYIGEDVFWIWKFRHGFDNGNELIITHTNFIANHDEVDKVSRFGNKMAIKYSKPRY